MNWIKNREKYARQYNEEKYEQLLMRVPKGTKAAIQAAAKEAGKSMTAYIMDAVKKAMESDSESSP